MKNYISIFLFLLMTVNAAKASNHPQFHCSILDPHPQIPNQLTIFEDSATNTFAVRFMGNSILSGLLQKREVADSLIYENEKMSLDIKIEDQNMARWYGELQTAEAKTRVICSNLYY